MKRRNFLTSTLAGFGAYTALWRDARAQGTSRAPKLKITAVKAALLRNTGNRFVRVHTDQGLTGTGETLDTVLAEDIIGKHMAPGLVGRDPLDIEAIYVHLWNSVFVRGMGGPYLNAMSGIDMALWDLAGKALGVPVYRLMGGRVRDKVAVYLDVRNPQHAAEVVRTIGVRAIKTPIGPRSGNSAPALDPGKRSGIRLTVEQIDGIAAYVASLRKAIGPNVEMGLDCHALFDPESAIQLGKAIETSRPMFLEEPTVSDNPDAMAQVRQSTRVPIACGENVYTRYGFRPFLEKQAVSVIQPDMAKCGGLLESRKIAAMAEIYGIPIAPHGMALPLGQLAYAHVCSTVPNFMILEWGPYFFEPLNKVVKRPPIVNGFLQVPDSPGIGAELNEDAIKEALPSGYSL